MQKYFEISRYLTMQMVFLRPEASMVPLAAAPSVTVTVTDLAADLRLLLERTDDV